MSTPKLPKGLPPLPPVPEGYDRWEYKGRGWGDCRPVGSPWGSYEPRLKHCAFNWTDADGSVFPSTHWAGGYRDVHYIVAVRDPKPAPKQRVAKVPEASFGKLKKRKERVVATVMHLSPHAVAYKSYVQAKSAGWNPADLTRINCLPADAASVERMVRQVAECIAGTSGTNMSDAQVAEVVLDAIGIEAKNSC